jgi:hypothetical protein
MTIATIKEDKDAKTVAVRSSTVNVCHWRLDRAIIKTTQVPIQPPAIMCSMPAQANRIPALAATVKKMKANLVELTELEKSFHKTRTDCHNQRDVVTAGLPKKIKIREGADLRYWWDEECDSTCARLESVG